jgi:hypothetical protein
MSVTGEERRVFLDRRQSDDDWTHGGDDLLRGKITIAIGGEKQQDLGRLECRGDLRKAEKGASRKGGQAGPAPP